MKQTKTRVFTGLIALLLLVSCNVGASDTKNIEEHKEVPSKKGKYYQVVLVWVKDPQKFQDYGAKMGPIVAKYGGRAERIMSPVNSFYGGETGKSLSQPHMVNIVYYDSKEAYEQFEKDPDFVKIKHLRSESIDMAGIGGTIEGGDLADGDLLQRLYMIEFAYYKDGHGKAYKDYRKKSKGFSERHGLRIERTLKPDAVFGNITMPDLVNVLYLEDASRKKAMEQDPQHAEVEKMYGEAIGDLIWIEGKALQF